MVEDAFSNTGLCAVMSRSGNIGHTHACPLYAMYNFCDTTCAPPVVAPHDGLLYCIYTITCYTTSDLVFSAKMPTSILMRDHRSCSKLLVDYNQTIS